MSIFFKIPVEATFRAGFLKRTAGIFNNTTRIGESKD